MSIAEGSDFDLLDDLMQTLRFRGSIFFHSSLASPWGIALPPIEMPRFHIALDGEFVVGSGDIQLRVPRMHIAMLPLGHGHWIADKPGRTLVDGDQAASACLLQPLFQEGPISHRILCGMVEYEHALSHPMISALPQLLLLGEFAADTNLWLTVELINKEISQSHTLRSPVIDRLTEVLFILLMKAYLAQRPGAGGFFGALTDTRLVRVLTAIHRMPAHNWTLMALAEVGNMSVATLVRHFNGDLGMSPVQYLAEWRLTKAYQLVKHSSQSLEQIADAVGFSGAKSLGRAFLRRFGLSPGKLRQQV
ncbi:AraC family transcriptional regulator [Shewanella khirikhana]|uniref:AraC family transcriptional regulator n=1 Tax=Shewanella khirikhana TaxID=1965282 RepID=UPI0030D2F0A8